MDELIKKYAAIANGIVADGTWVELTPVGLLFDFAQEVQRIQEENAAWDEHSRRKAEGL